MTGTTVDLNHHHHPSEEKKHSLKASNKVAIDFDLANNPSSGLLSKEPNSSSPIETTASLLSLNQSNNERTGHENNNDTDKETNLNNNLHSYSMDRESDEGTERKTESLTPEPSTGENIQRTAASSDPSLTVTEEESKSVSGTTPKMTSSKKTAPQPTTGSRYGSRGRYASHGGGDGAHHHHQQQQQQQHQHRASTGTGIGSQGRLPDFPLRIVVNTDMVGAVIGKSGGTIKEITRESKARVDVLRKETSGTIDKVICIFGSPEHTSKACLKIMQVIREEALHLQKDPNDFPLKILAHNALIGRIIGKSGITIKKIMETTETKITVSSNLFDSSTFATPERVITIIGETVEAACSAEEQISAKLRSCYENEFALASMVPPVFPGFPPPPTAMYAGLPGMMPPSMSLGNGSHGRGEGPSRGVSAFSGSVLNHQLMTSPPAALLHHHPPAFPSFGPHSHPGPLSPPSGLPFHQTGDSSKYTVNIYVPSFAVGIIIGPKGSTIREMIQMTGANVKVPQSKGPSPSGDQSAERRVSVVGTQEAQFRAQYNIFKRVLVDSAPNIPLESTLRVEIFVPSSQVGRIIGKNGQTVRELQRLTHAQIKLPDPSSEEGSAAASSPDAETPVSITGDFYGTWVCFKHCFVIQNVFVTLFFLFHRLLKDKSEL